MILTIIILIFSASLIGFLVYKSNLQKKKIEKIRKIYKKIEEWKNPAISEINDYNAAISMQDNEARRAAGLYLIAETYFHKIDKTDRELKRLRDIYSELMEKHCRFEKMEDVLFKLANVYFFDYFNFIESMKFYEKLLKEFPASKWMKVASERLNLAKSAYPNEESALKKYALAEKYFEVQDYDKTIEFLKSILLAYPNSKLAGTSYYFLGDIFFYKKSDYNAALNFYSQLVEKIPHHRYAGNALFKIGETYRKLRKSDEAITAYKKFLENYNELQYIDYAQYYIGQCYEDMRDWTLALRTYKLLVANYAESIWVGIALSKIKNLEKLIR